MSYQDYLNNWQSNFGEATSGEYGYWRAGKHFPVIVHLLSAEEFELHSAGLDTASVKFAEALERNDDTAMLSALEESFPHELALVI